ncbi:MAG: hypothetical protein GC179_25665 [Anaerolineaceae bacterium]|nr:hypothetical protein [Anaerolineaceae bacterium]
MKLIKSIRDFYVRLNIKRRDAIIVGLWIVLGISLGLAQVMDYYKVSAQLRDNGKIAVGWVTEHSYGSSEDADPGSISYVFDVDGERLKDTIDSLEPYKLYDVGDHLDILYLAQNPKIHQTKYDNEHFWGHAVGLFWGGFIVVSLIFFAVWVVSYCVFSPLFRLTKRLSLQR